MSSGELLLTLTIALIVFGPSKLPMLAHHLGLLFRKLNQFRAAAQAFWQEQVNEFQLQENTHKAAEADERYKNTMPILPSVSEENAQGTDEGKPS